MGFFDAFLVAPLGDAALAAATTGAMNSYIIVILPMGIASIVQSFASQLKGRDELVRARRYAWYGFGVAAIFGLVAVAAIPFVDDLLGLLAFTPEVRDLQAEYIVVRLTAVGAVVAMEGLGNWFSGLGNTKIQMRASVVTLAVDLPLNFVLIEGRLGFPALGLFGAALSTAIGGWAGFIYVAIVFWRSPVGRAKRLGLRRVELWRVFRFGLPHGLNWFFEFSAFVWFINSVMVHLGTVPLAALNVVFSVNTVSFMPAFGIASAGAILVGQAVGAKNHAEVPRVLKLTAGVSMAWMGAIALTYVIAPDAIFALFVAEGDVDAPTLLAVGATMLAVSSCWQLFDALGMTLSESLRAVGDTSWPLRARLVLAWFLFVPGAWYTVVHLKGGVTAAMICLIAYLVLLAAVLYYRYRSGAWKKIELVDDLPPEALEP